MAHFAELNSSNEVLRVVVISNDDVDANGGDQHADAETFVTTIVPYGTGGVAWKQTSYNNNFRKQYAGTGMNYDASKNKFLLPKPFASWALDSNDDWQAPVTYPTVTEIDSKILFIDWDEDNQKWLGRIESTNYSWNATNLQWNEV
tara:strand:+ start:1905 stop:2342 length:438 start_codon:yes stop_codon:yes gene_type:complete